MAVPQLHVAPADVGAYDAVALFVARARQTDLRFALTAANAGLVAQLCRSLDGLPLALELAAARLGVLAMTQLASELSSSLDVLTARATPAARHDSLAHCLNRTLARLSPEAQTLFRRVGAFSSVWTLADAQSVCTDDLLPADAVLPLLADLVDAALVQAQPGRGPSLFSLLHTTRLHALALLLSASDEFNAVLAKHATWAVDAPRDFGVPLKPSDAPEPLLGPHPAVAALTPREMEVARCIALGQSTRQIADTLIISEGTVRVHVEHIRTKLGVASRADIGKLIA
jgi:non-specific serine/threonine protein kinase